MSFAPTGADKLPVMAYVILGIASVVVVTIFSFAAFVIWKLWRRESEKRQRFAQPRASPIPRSSMRWLGPLHANRHWNMPANEGSILPITMPQQAQQAEISARSDHEIPTTPYSPYEMSHPVKSVQFASSPQQESRMVS